MLLSTSKESFKEGTIVVTLASKAYDPEHLHMLAKNRNPTKHSA